MKTKILRNIFASATVLFAFAVPLTADASEPAIITFDPPPSNGQVNRPTRSAKTVLHDFTPYLNGTSPYGNVCLGPGGMLFGTTNSGGSRNAGAVYRINGAGEAVLYSFTGGADGSGPSSSLLCNSAGQLYGTTSFGGAAGAGVVFRVNGAGHESVLYSFTGGDDGGYPFGGLLQDSAGNLYGATNSGGSAGAGVVFKLDREGHETVLHTFTGADDGAYPIGDLIQDPAGNLYGTTSYGGAGGAGAGVVYKLDPKGNLTVLYTFTGGNDGGYPYAGVTRDSAGNLYGTTNIGGSAGGAGVVFKLDPMGNETVLYNFTGGADGGYPYAGVTRDAAGNLYGTTTYGGSPAGQGVVFKVDTNGNETVLYTFTGKDGASPIAGVTRDSAGNLYGVTSGGGSSNLGALFKLDTTGKETVLFGFPATDGANPVAGVIQDSAGNLYGTTQGGGTDGAGLVFKLDGRGRETVLHTFTGGADGAEPLGGLIQDAAGNFYGTTEYGGAAGAGVVFKLDPNGNETVLYSFTGGADGAYPLAGVTMDSAGNLYGTTLDGGSAGIGVVFKLDPMGHETVLHSFAGPDGQWPYSGVTFDSAGNLYGTTFWGGVPNGFPRGVVYKLDPAGNYTLLHSFEFATGADPVGGVTLDAAGNLYGTTWSGGPASGEYPGAVFKIDTGENFSLLYSFTGFADGGGSRSNMVLDLAGNLYGTTQYGGQGPCPYFGCGVVFELNPSGQQTVLYSFSGGADGAEPGTGLIRDAAGNLFGTTEQGGTEGAGVVYRLTPSGS